MNEDELRLAGTARAVGDRHSIPRLDRAVAKKNQLPSSEISVGRKAERTIFDFGEWKSEVASKSNPDGTTSFVIIGPGVSGFEFVVGAGEEKTLTLRDAQREYVFEVAAQETPSN